MDKDPTGENILRDTLLRDKPAQMLVFMAKGNEPKYVTQISKATDCTYSHVIKVLNTFKILNLLEFEKKGRIKIVKLTSDGRDIAHDLEGILMKIKRVGDNIKKQVKNHNKKDDKPPGVNTKK